MFGGTGTDVLDGADDFAAVLGKTRQVGADLRISLSATESILLKNVTLAAFDASDVMFH